MKALTLAVARAVRACARFSKRSGMSFGALLDELAAVIDQLGGTTSAPPEHAPTTARSRQALDDLLRPRGAPPAAPDEDT